MPEQTVQVTPSAPKFNTHKVFAAIGIILTAAIIAAAAIWYFTGGNTSLTPLFFFPIEKAAYYRQPPLPASIISLPLLLL